MQPESPVKIVEVYRDFVPSRDVQRLVEQMLVFVPPAYLHGLDHILLTNSKARSRKKRRSKSPSRSRKVRQDTARGLYHRAYKDDPAHVVLFIDQILNMDEVFGEIPAPFRKLMRVGTNMRLAETLYHEIGHHIQRAHHRETREPETVAEEYGVYFLARYTRKRYWWLRWPMRMMRLLTVFLPDDLRSSFDQARKRRTISSKRLGVLKRREHEAVAAWTRARPE